MVRPRVARRFRPAGGERSCINVSGLSLERAPGHHGYQRACELITGKASTGPFGSPVFTCAGKTEPLSLLILSQTSAGNWTSCECSRGLKPRFKNAAVSQHADSDCRALISCRGWCGRRSRSVWARDPTKRRNHGPWRTHRRSRSRPPSHSR